jgi:uncharacterized protein
VSGPRALAAALVLLAARPAAAQGVAHDAASGTGGAWSPYLVGALLGVLSWSTFLLSRKAVGASSSYAQAAGLVGRAVAPRHTASLGYYRENPPRVDWFLVFVAAAVVGAFLAAWTGGELTGRFVPPMWAERFGAGSWALRGAFAFLGGGLAAFGARMAGGCTSGHGISGTLQLSAASWVALFCFFASGVVTAWLMYRL